MALPALHIVRLGKRCGSPESDLRPTASINHIEDVSVLPQAGCQFASRPSKAR